MPSLVQSWAPLEQPLSSELELSDISSTCPTSASRVIALPLILSGIYLRFVCTKKMPHRASLVLVLQRKSKITVTYTKKISEFMRGDDAGFYEGLF